LPNHELFVAGQLEQAVEQGPALVEQSALVDASQPGGSTSGEDGEGEGHGLSYIAI